jgi:fatty acid desaturase
LLLCPWVLRLRALRRADSRLATQTGADAMLSGLDKVATRRMRLEILLTILLQCVAFWSLHLSVMGWLLCYVFFAVNWSSLQYADHAWSERDVHNGAWNLKVNRVVQYVFLNYHHHRAHHQNPNTPWLHLAKYVDWSEKRHSYIDIYMKMWRGPRPYHE